jgi:hypothetical protein
MQRTSSSLTAGALWLALARRDEMTGQQLSDLGSGRRVRADGAGNDLDRRLEIGRS